MTNTIGSAVIEVGIDSRAVESGFAKIDGSITKTGKTIENLGAAATGGFNKIGDGGDAAAGRVERAAKALADSVRNTDAAMAAGKKANAEYYAALASSKVGSATAAAPLVGQINAISDAEKSRASLFEKGLAETKRLLGAAGAAAESAKKSMAGLRLDAQQFLIPNGAIESLKGWRARIAQALQGGVDDGAEDAKGSLDGVADFAKEKVAIFGVAAVTGMSALLIGAAVAAYKAADFAAGLVTGSSYKNPNVDALLAMNRPIGELKEAFKLTTNEASGLAATLAEMGTSTKDYIQGFQEASSAIRGNADQLDALGVSYKDAAGNLLPLKDVLTNVSTVLDQYSAGWERNAVAMMLGFSSADQVDTSLSITAERLAEVTKRQAEYGLLIGPEKRAEISAYRTAMREFNIEMDNTSQGFKRAIADVMMPILTDFAVLLKDGWPSVVQVFRTAINTIGSAFYYVKGAVVNAYEVFAGTVSSMGSLLSGLSTAVSSVFRGDFTSALDAFITSYDKARARFLEIGANILEAAKKNSASLKSVWAGQEFPAASKTVATEKTAVDAKGVIAAAEAYKTATAAIKEKIDVQKNEIAGNAKLTEGQRLQVQFNNEVASGKSKLDEAGKKAYASQLEELIAQEKINQKKQEGTKAGLAAAEAEASSYAQLISAIRTKTEENRLEILIGANATDSQKVSIKLDQELASGKRVLSAEHLAVARAALVEQGASERLLKEKQAEKNVKKYVDDGDLFRKEAASQLAAEYEMYGKSTDAREIAMVAIKEQAALEKFLQQARSDGMSIAPKQIVMLNDEVAARTAVAQATLKQSKALGYAAQLQAENKKFSADCIADEKERNAALLKIEADVWQERISLAGAGTEAQKLLQENYAIWYANQLRKPDLDSGKKAREDLDAFLDPAKAQSFGDALKGAFGGAGDAIVQMTGALKDFGQRQAEIDKQRGNAALAYKAGRTTEVDYLKQTAALSAMDTKNRLAGYGDMAGAAAGFFGEQSKGYKTLMAVSQVFHAAELAMTLAELVPKAISAVLTQGSGDPYTAFGRMAAMAAIVAGLGVAIGAGGGGNVDVAKERQKANGTGTVLGDSSAKSESIAHSLAIMEKNSGLGLAHTISMDSSLKQMVAGIGNLSSLLARDGVTAAGGGAAAGVQTGTKVLGGTLGTVTGAVAGGVGGAALGTYLGMGMAAIGGPLGLAIGAVLGTVLGGVVSKLFNTSTSIKDQGITGKAMLLGDVDALGFAAQAYADINTKKKAFGISYSNKNSTQTAALSDEMNDQFSMIISSMGDTIRSAADVLGLGGDAFNAKLNTFVVDLGKISLKDLSGEEQQKALETAFSKLGDDMAKFGVAGLAQYQAVGEGYLETLVRVTNDYMQVSDVLAVLGKSFNTTGLGAVALSESLITAAGGLDKLTSGTSFFVENFLTEAERMAPITKSVNDAMGKLGVSGVTTVDQFKALVLAQDLNTAAGQAMYAQLIAIAEPFKKAADYAAELAAATGDFAAVAKTASEIASEHRDLQQQLNELTKSEAQLLAIQRDGIASVNRALFDQVQAAKAVVTAKDALSKAYDTEKSAMTSSLAALKSWATTVGGLNASLALGNQSILTPEQRYAEARAQFEKTLAAANAGDSTAQSGLSAAEQAFLTASQVVNASDAKYVADYARVMAANDEAMRWASTQVDVQQASLDALTAQVSGLITINDSVLTVAQAIASLQVAMGVSNGLGVEFTNAPAVAVQAALTSAPVPVVFDATRYSAGSNAGSDALVAEIRGLREDNKALQKAVDGLRAEQKDQTGAAIRATVESNANAAKTVVAGVEKSANKSAWENANRKAEYV